MRIDEAIRAVEALASGCDPKTGEELDQIQVVLRPDISEALIAVTEALQVVRSAVVVPVATPATKSPDPDGNSPATAYDLAHSKFGVLATGGPPRFRRPGWFYVGRAVVCCPTCQEQMEAFRCPYTTRAGLRFHYWALLCTQCRRYFEPSQLGPMRQVLYNSSDHRPSDEQKF